MQTNIYSNGVGFISFIRGSDKEEEDERVSNDEYLKEAISAYQYRNKVFYPFIKK